MQKCIENASGSVARDLIGWVLSGENYENLAKGKYSSHICDVAFRLSDFQQKRDFVNYLVTNPNRNPKSKTGNSNIDNTPCFRLIVHEYGSFVFKNVLTAIINPTQKMDNGKQEKKMIDQAQAENLNNNTNNNGNNNYAEYKELETVLLDYLEKIYPLLENMDISDGDKSENLNSSNSSCSSSSINKSTSRICANLARDIDFDDTLERHRGGCVSNIMVIFERKRGQNEEKKEKK